MARKKKAPPEGPSKAYLVSFGDTMTALLAFFIVLNSLATEQTGAKLYSGTGSFVNAIDSAGLPGVFTNNSSAQPTQFEATAPQYGIDDPDHPGDDQLSTGTDDTDKQERSIDRDREEFEKFMRDIDQSFEVKSEPSAQGELAFDVFDRIAKKPPILPPDAKHLLPQIMPLLTNERYRVRVVVWATTPSPSAWQRATEQSAAIVQELSSGLHAEQRARLEPIARPWGSSDVKRPSMSFIVVRLP